MSWVAVAWAKATRGHRGRPAQKLVLMVLADYYREKEGCAWPSQERIADDAEVSLRTVKDALKNLETGGFIKRRQRGNQYQRSEYELMLDTAPTQKSEGAVYDKMKVQVQSTTSEGAVYDIMKVQSTTSEGAVPVHSNLQEPIEEPTEEPIEEKRKRISPWLEILSQDKRFQKADLSGFQANVELAFSEVDLLAEATHMLEWLQTPRGKERKEVKRFATSWLKRSKEDITKNGRKKADGRTDPVYEKYRSTAT